MSSSYFIKSVRPYLGEAEDLPEELQLRFLKFALHGNYANNFSEIKKCFSSLKITTKSSLYNLCGTFIELVKLSQRLKPRDFQDTLQEYGVGLKFIENILKTVQSLSMECTIPNQKASLVQVV
ncbi:uncharacterized protein LOC108745160 [Agrilus planipennis]|uniref:Uncharacterized protein LOC108745160 n=1 Tax=Agrilus planipennis TaxID=224129 RepID=A0A1W4XWA8_AGRPL|nr:uncharacterized protein LOC108745160 [Agrilus planipennis]